LDAGGRGGPVGIRLGGFSLGAHAARCRGALASRGVVGGLFGILVAVEQRGEEAALLRGGDGAVAALKVGLRQLIRSTLELPEGRRLSRTLERLGHLSHGDCGTKRIQTTVREFLNGLQHYRAYLMHPQLGLPRTTNTVESMCRLLRELLRSSRAGSNPASVLLWATALIRMRPRVACNGHSFNRIN